METPKLTVTSVYAPTECSLPDNKDDFYNDLNNHLEQMKPHNIHLVVGELVWIAIQFTPK